ncbi:hypothetical protein OHV93_04670 [Acinetobacter baumannii]|nr:hypothetical protein [Acinetobacter baumannii]MDC4931721.1 hypothetical protein [Acinetobacter baumannii]
MQFIYLPENIYFALESNPNLPIKVIMEISKRGRATAYRYRTGYRKLKNEPNSYQVIHVYEKVDISGFRKNNNQKKDLYYFIVELLQGEGFVSTKDLITKFYVNYPIYRGQTKNNFNKYFKMVRDDLERQKISYKLFIRKSPIVKIGFHTIENPDFGSSDC